MRLVAGLSSHRANHPDPSAGGLDRAVRVTSIEATDFLSFEELSLSLDSGLNVIVGPGGTGKSTVVRILDLVTQVVDWSETSDARTQTALGQYASALRHDATGHGFCVRVGVELDQPEERQRIVTFVRAAAMSALLGLTSDQTRDDEVRHAITEQHLHSLFRGKLAVTFDARLGGGWSVGYEFAYDSRSYCYVLRGLPPAGQIVPGPLAPSHPPYQSGRTLTPRMLPQGTDQPVSFDLASLLPANDAASLVVDPFDPSRLTPTLREFAEFAEADLTQPRYYTLASMLRPILHGSLILRTDQRLPPRQDYDPTALGTQPPLTDPSQLPLELFRLKAGSLGDRRRYQRLQAVFGEFTGLDFDVRVRAIPGAD
jgi:hypothetical protein